MQVEVTPEGQVRVKAHGDRDLTSQQARELADQLTQAAYQAEQNPAMLIPIKDQLNAVELTREQARELKTLIDKRVLK
jgi:hypothetical protein